MKILWLNKLNPTYLALFDIASDSIAIQYYHLTMNEEINSLFNYSESKVYRNKKLFPVQCDVYFYTDDEFFEDLCQFGKEYVSIWNPSSLKWDEKEQLSKGKLTILKQDLKKYLKISEIESTIDIHQKRIEAVVKSLSKELVTKKSFVYAYKIITKMKKQKKTNIKLSDVLKNKELLVLLVDRKIKITRSVI